MSVTAQEIFDIVMDLADERDPTTGVINATDTQDYNVRTPGILTSIQSSLLQEGKHTKTHTITRTRPLTAVASFEPLVYEGEDKTIEGNSKCYGYAFTATGTGTVYIEDNNGAWQTIATINAVADTEYTGEVTPSAGATQCRIRLSGTYSFAIVDYALYRVNYEVSPSYGAKVLETMPSDFNTPNDIVSESYGEYTQNRPYEFEQNNQLYVDVNFQGVIRIVYYPNVAAITALTDTMTLNDRLCKSTIAYMLGMELYKEKNDILYNHFRLMYQDTRAMNKVPKKGNVGVVYDSYGGF